MITIFDNVLENGVSNILDENWRHNIEAPVLMHKNVFHSLHFRVAQGMVLVPKQALHPRIARILLWKTVFKQFLM